MGIVAAWLGAWLTRSSCLLVVSRRVWRFVKREGRVWLSFLSFGFNSVKEEKETCPSAGDSDWTWKLKSGCYVSLSSNPCRNTVLYAAHILHQALYKGMQQLFSQLKYVLDVFIKSNYSFKKMIFSP